MKRAAFVLDQVSRLGPKCELDPLGFKDAHDLQVDLFGKSYEVPIIGRVKPVYRHDIEGIGDAQIIGTAMSAEPDNQPVRLEAGLIAY